MKGHARVRGLHQILQQPIRVLLFVYKYYNRALLLVVTQQLQQLQELVLFLKDNLKRTVSTLHSSTATDPSSTEPSETFLSPAVLKSHIIKNRPRQSSSMNKQPTVLKTDPVKHGRCATLLRECFYKHTTCCSTSEHTMLLPPTCTSTGLDNILRARASMALGNVAENITVCRSGRMLSTMRMT